MGFLLTGHLLNGKVVGIETPLVSAIEQPFKIEETVSPGYQNISTIENWYNYGRNLGKDYLFIRKEIKILIEEKGIASAIASQSTPPASPSDNDLYYISMDAVATDAWAGYEGWMATWSESPAEWLFEPPSFVGYRLLNDNETEIAAGYKIGSQADHFADYGVPEVSDYGLEYHKKSIEAREERLLRTAAEVYNRLPLYSSLILGDLIGNPHGDLTTLYISWGVKGTLEDFNVDFNPVPSPGIIDYMYGRYPYDGNVDGYPTGLLLKSGITPIDAISLQDFCDEMYDILVRGLW